MIKIIIPEIHISETVLTIKHLLAFIGAFIIVLLMATKSWNYW